jgi:acyl carrier protein
MVSEKQLRGVIAEVVPTIDIASLPTHGVFADNGIDSLDHASILLALQERHGLIVPDEDLPRTTSIAGILSYAAERQPRA